MSESLENISSDPAAPRRLDRPRVAILVNVVPHYRRAFFDKLAECDEFDFTVFCQTRNPGKNLKFIHDELKLKVVKVGLIGREHRVAWQTLPFWKLLRDFDVYVAYGNPRYLSSLLFVTLLKLLGRPVVIHNQAFTAGARGESLRLGWWRLFQHFLVYTDHEAERLRRYGFGRKQITGWNNGLDLAPTRDATHLWPPDRLAAWQSSCGVEGRHMLLSVARLDPKNQFALMLDALPRLTTQYPKLLWVVIGDGEERALLEERTREQGLEDHVRFCGAIYDEEHLAPWFLSSQALVHPGAIGLTLMHAFAYRLPVITHSNPANQMPEFAAAQHGQNALLFSEGDVDGLASAIAQVLDDGELRDRLSENGHRVVLEDYNTDVMAERYCQAIRHALR